MSDFMRECHRLISEQSAKELAILNKYIFKRSVRNGETYAKTTTVC